MRTAFTSMCSVSAPIAGFSRSPRVVSEVSRAGGLGVMAASSYSPAELWAQLEWISRQVEGAPFGVDVLIPAGNTGGADLLSDLRRDVPTEHLEFVERLLHEYGIDPQAFRDRVDRGNSTVVSLSPSGIEELLEVAFEFPIALIANALGPPPQLMVDRAHDAGVPVAALVGTAEHARRQIDFGADILVAQGTEAGGHTGQIATTVLTPEVLDVAKGRPVLAAGGIAQGRQMAAALALGADGVWCGSVWLSSEEDITPRWIKEKFLIATSADTVRSPARTGKPARQLRSAWHDAWDRPDSPQPLPMQQQLLISKAAWETIDEAAEAGSPGAQELGSFFIGQVVGGFAELRATGDIVATMMSECNAAIERVKLLYRDGELH